MVVDGGDGGGVLLFPQVFVDCELIVKHIC